MRRISYLFPRPDGVYIYRFRPSTYHEFRLNGLAYLDTIASALLAISYSRRTSPTPSSQSLIQNDCVAVCHSMEGFWVASNSKQITDDDLYVLKQVMGIIPDIYIVTNGDNSMHAEMQLVSELNLDPTMSTGSPFGVSKPCCHLCATQLDEHNIGYTNWHDASVGEWRLPY